MSFYAGMDTDLNPGLDYLKAAKLYTNWSWLGYYFKAPSHADGSWLGHRQAISDLGFGILPIYVGQQLQGPGSKVLTADQGEADADEACQAMWDEGFPDDSFVFLDCEEGPENGNTLDPNRVLYLMAWAQQVEANGFGVGVYTSHLLGKAVGGLLPNARIWCTRLLQATQAEHTTRTFPVMNPAGCGYPAAMAWQHTDNVTVFPSGTPHKLMVDLSVSLTADPGAPPVLTPSALS